MIKRPLLAVGTGLAAGLCILAAAGFPGIGRPARQECIRPYTKQEVPVTITGRVYRRIEKEKTYQYYIKDAILEIQSKSQVHQSMKDQTADQAVLWKNNQIIDPIHKQENISIVKTAESRTGYQEGKQMFFEKQTVPISGNILVIAGKEKNQSGGKIPVCMIGSHIRVQGCLEDIELPGNPGQFDSASYYAARGIFYSVWAEQLWISEQREGFSEQAEQLRQKMVRNLEEMLPKRHAGILAAMLLGDKSSLDPDTKLNYEAGSLLHMISISGLHLMLLGMGLYGSLRRLRMPEAASAIAAGAVMAFYCWVTGSQAATLRALVMFYVILGAKVTGRSYDSLSSMSLSFILLLAENRCYLFYSGFQLSFAAVVGAGVIYPVWRDIMRGEYPIRTKWQKGKLFLKDHILACMAITFTTLPLTCYYFYQIPLFGLLTNLLILPIMPMVLIPGAAGTAVGLFHITVGKLLLLPAWTLLEICDMVLKVIRAVPGAVYICGQPEIWQIFVYYLLLAAVTWRMKRILEKKVEEGVCIKREEMRDRRRRKVEGISENSKLIKGVKIITDSRGGVVLLMIAAVFLLMWRKPVALSITALDVGQGDSIVLRSGAEAYLIDGGSSSEKQVGTYRILPYLKSQGIRRLAGIIVTHPDEDHINGILELLEQAAAKQTGIRIERLFLPVWMRASEEEQQFLEVSEKAGIPVFYLQRGDQIQQEELRIQVLHPDEKDYCEVPNSGSVTLGVHYRAFDALLTGDLEGDGEKKVLEEMEAYKESKGYEYLKVAHHGSKNSTMEEFLEVIQPQIAVISCGENNTYGHPHQETLNRLKKQKTEIYDTPADGAVTVSVDGDLLKVRRWKQTTG